MKNLIFSKKYLKTKLGILTLIVTVAYHYLNKDKSLYDGMKQGIDSELKNDSKKDEELSGYTLDDEYTAENIPDESPYDENDAIISSEWIIEYWNSIRDRKPAINVPQLSQGIISDSKIRKLDISEFLDSQIIQDLVKLIKDEKYYSKNGLHVFKLATDFGEFANVPFEWAVNKAKDVKVFAKETLANSKEIAQSGWSKFKNGVSYLYNGFMGLFTTSSNTETNADQHQDRDNNTMLNTIPNNVLQIEENRTQLNTTVNVIVQHQDENNNTMLNTTLNNAVQHQDENNNTMLNTTLNNAIQQVKKNNTSLDTTLNDENVVEQVNGGFMVKTRMFFAEFYENIKTKWHQISSYILPNL